MIVAVGHRMYNGMGLAGIAPMCREGGPAIVPDVKALLTVAEAASLGIRCERL